MTNNIYWKTHQLEALKGQFHTMFGSPDLPLWQQLDYRVTYYEQLFAAMIRWGNNSNHTRLFLVRLFLTQNLHLFFTISCFINKSHQWSQPLAAVLILSLLCRCSFSAVQPAAQATSPAVQGIVLQKQGAKVWTLPLFSCRDMKSNLVFILWFGFFCREVLLDFLLLPHSAGLNFPSFFCSVVIHFSVIPLTLFQIQETQTKWCIWNPFILYSTHVAWRIKKLKYYS